jgi:hypothetical protein
MPPLIGMTVVGLRGTITALDVGVAATVAKAVAGLEAGARIIQVRARANVAGRRYHGRLDASITVGAPDLSVPGTVRVGVGVQPGVWAPEGRTFEFGWHSKSGKRPPVKPLMLWAMERGLASDERTAKKIAFVVARNIGDRGYSFGQSHWLDNAARDTLPAVAATVRTAIRL